MGSTGEADRKRRQFSSLSPTGAAAKKQPFLPLSVDKKLDTTVLEFQNQKLVQKLEAQKVEIINIEDKISNLRRKQLPYDCTLAVVSKSWEELVDGVKSHSGRIKNLRFEQGVKNQLARGSDRQQTFSDGVSTSADASSSDDSFLYRLFLTGATDNSSTNSTNADIGEDAHREVGRIKNALCNVVSSIDVQWLWKDELLRSLLSALPEDGSQQQHSSLELRREVNGLRLVIDDLLAKHASLAGEFQSHMDTDAKNKAELKRLKVELVSTVAELEDSNNQLSNLKVEKDVTNGAFFPILNLKNRPVSGDKARDRQKDLQDLECTLEELLDQSSSRLLELNRLNEERIDILKRLCTLQKSLKNFKCICSSQAYQLLKDQLVKAKADVFQNQSLCEKLQVERESLSWHEKEMYLKSELLDLYHQSLSVAETRISELEKDIQKNLNERNLNEEKLEKASKERGRKEIIAKFKTLVSSFPDKMSTMQNQLGDYKGSVSDVHALRAEVKSLSNILERKAKELQKLSSGSAEQADQIRKFQALVRDFKQSNMELKLIQEMYRRESTASRDILEARDSEYKVWAYVQSLKISLDEHNLELRVKTAIEAEAISQQRLAATEAEIAELRQKLDTSKRERSSLSDVAKSKHEETEAYLSEIGTIGQAYDDMQTQNQQLLQQITERDDYNIKLVLEGVRSRQLVNGLLREKQTIERAIHQRNGAFDFHDMKLLRVEDQLKMCSDQIQRLTENRVRSMVSLENNERRMEEVRKLSLQLKETVEKLQNKVDEYRVGLAEMQIETETERFKRKREKEDLEFSRSKATRLNSQKECSCVVDKLRQELREYREILKCSICRDRRKEVVIGKCYHLFCNPCVQRIINGRHRKCPVCAASFSVNDVKPVYI